MESEHILQSLTSSRLELEYERCLRQAERIYEEERVRALRVQLLLLEDDHDSSREASEGLRDDLQRSEDVAQDLRDHVADLDEQYQSTQAELKACVRDIDHYQAEINAMTAASTDNSKLLSEKLALSRELANLKPELEHLRHQAATQQGALADKLSLQRELSSIQVELETEKRTVNRLRTQNSSGDSALHEEIEDLRKQLAQERKTLSKLEREQNKKKASEKASADAALVDEVELLKEQLAEEKRRAQVAQNEQQKTSTGNNAAAETIEELQKEISVLQKATQKAERDAFKRSSEWETQKDVLESKLDAFRTKLRSTKDQLREAQEELERRQAAKFAESAAATKARLTGNANTTTDQANPKKRNVARFDPDMTIGTPGNGGLAAKRQKQRGLSNNVGDKSTFSITPFLNRTLSVLPESPAIDAHERASEALEKQIDAIAEEVMDEHDQEQQISKKVAKKPAKEKAKVATKNTNPTKQPLKETTNSKANSVKKTAFDKVIGESTGDVQENVTVATTSSEATTAEPKKRKLGAPKTLFDDEEDAKIFKKPGLSKIRLGAAKGRPKTLAEFSPLKADRRAGSASILVS